MNAKLTTSHDRLTLKIKDSKNKINLTVSRRGETISGSDMAQMKTAFPKFSKALKNAPTYGEAMKKLETEALLHPNIHSFIEAM